MKKFFIVTGLFIAIQLNAQETTKQIYESPNLAVNIGKHKMVAILPFKATITYRRPPKNFDEAQHKAEEDNLGSSLQTEMYTYLLRKRSEYTVDFQDVERSNALLKKAGIFDKIEESTADTIASLLGVDAIIKGNYTYQKTSSEGGAIVKSVLFGGVGAKIGSGKINMQINDRDKGELLWRFSKSMDDNVFSSAGQLIERMMRKISRNFPYEVQK